MNRGKGFLLLPLSTVVVLLWLSTFVFGQNLETSVGIKEHKSQNEVRKKFEEVSEKAEKLIATESEVCIKQGKSMYQQLLAELLRNKEIREESIMAGYIYERMGYADVKAEPRFNIREDYNRALTIYAKVPNQKGRFREASTLYLMATGYGNQTAIKHLLKALTIAKKLPNGRELQATILSELGERYYKLGKKRTALKYDRQALALWERLKDISWQCFVISNIGWDYFDKARNDNRKTLNYVQKALKLSETSASDKAKIRALANVASFYSETEDTEKANKYYNLALDIAQKTNDKTWQKEIYDNLANMYNKLNNEEKRLEYTKLYNNLNSELKDCVVSE